MKKRVLITATELHLVQFWLYHIEHLIKDGYDVDLICSNVGGKLDVLRESLKELGNPKLKIINLFRSPLQPGNIKGLKQLLQHFKQNKYDLVITNEPVMGLMTRLAFFLSGQRKKSKIIYFAHGFHFWKGAPIKNWMIFYPIERLASYITDTIVTMNSEDYSFAKSKFRHPKIEYIYGIGIDFSDFKYDENVRIRKRESLNLSNDDFIIFTVSELTDRKNLFLALNAVKKVVERGYKFKYFIRGKGELEQVYRQFINENNLSDYVFLLGYGKDIPELCNAADVFLFTSKQEGLPVCLLEAMSCRLPCVVSDIRGSNDLIKNGEGGFICPLDSPEAFADKLILLYSEKNKSNYRYKYSADQSIIENYRVENVYKSIVSLLN